jgi:hypothetical protein
MRAARFRRREFFATCFGAGEGAVTQLTMSVASPRHYVPIAQQGQAVFADAACSDRRHPGKAWNFYRRPGAMLGPISKLPVTVKTPRHHAARFQKGQIVEQASSDGLSVSQACYFGWNRAAFTACAEFRRTAIPELADAVVAPGCDGSRRRRGRRTHDREHEHEA